MVSPIFGTWLIFYIQGWSLLTQKYQLALVAVVRGFGSLFPAVPIHFHAAAAVQAGIWAMPSAHGGLGEVRESGLEGCAIILFQMSRSWSALFWKLFWSLQWKHSELSLDSIPAPVPTLRTVGATGQHPLGQGLLLGNTILTAGHWKTTHFGSESFHPTSSPSMLQEGPHYPVQLRSYGQPRPKIQQDFKSYCLI